MIVPQRSALSNLMTSIRKCLIFLFQNVIAMYKISEKLQCGVFSNLDRQAFEYSIDQFISYGSITKKCKDLEKLKIIFLTKFSLSSAGMT